MTHTIVPLHPPIDPPICTQGGRAVVPRRRRRPPPLLAKKGDSAGKTGNVARCRGRPSSPVANRGDGRHRFSAGAAAIRWSGRRKSTVAIKGERLRQHIRSRDDQTRTLGSIFVEIASSVAEIWASASAAWEAGGGSILERFCGLRSAAQKNLSRTTAFLNWTEP